MPETKTLSSFTTEEAFEIGKTILGQISTATKMQAAARDYVAGNLNPTGKNEQPGLMFRVTKMSSPRRIHKIVITLDAGKDTYEARLFKMNRSKGTSELLEEHTDVYVESLAELIFEMTS